MNLRKLSHTLTHAHSDLDQLFQEAFPTACKALNLISLLFMVVYNIHEIIYSINQITLGDMNMENIVGQPPSSTSSQATGPTHLERDQLICKKINRKLVVDREVVDREVVDSEVLDREVLDREVADRVAVITTRGTIISKY